MKKKEETASAVSETETVKETEATSAVPAAVEVMKPTTYEELTALVKEGHASGPFRGFEVEKKKSYRNLMSGYTLRMAGKAIAVPGHPEDAAAFLRSKVSGEILVWKLSAEGKVATVRSCASGSGKLIVVRTSDLQFKRFAPDAKPSGARSSGKAGNLVAEEDPAV